MEEPETGEVQIMLTSEEDPVSMRSLGAQYLSKLVKISGITFAASRTKAKATYVTLLCKNCKNVKVIPCRPGLGGQSYHIHVTTCLRPEKNHVPLIPG